MSSGNDVIFIQDGATTVRGHVVYISGNQGDEFPLRLVSVASTHNLVKAGGQVTRVESRLRRKTESYKSVKGLDELNSRCYALKFFNVLSREKYTRLWS